jgi:hypothetical protein
VVSVLLTILQILYYPSANIVAKAWATITKIQKNMPFPQLLGNG